MKIIQVLPTLAFGDAIGNHTIALNKVIQGMGIETQIVAEVIDSRLPKGIASSVDKLSELNKDDIVLCHLSTGCKLNEWMSKINNRKIIEYHNITPPEYFTNYNFRAKENARLGREQALFLADKVDYCLADSEFNKEELKTIGYNSTIDVAPILIPFSDYEKEPDKKILKKYRDGKINILFTGRIAPNKKHESMIEAFYYYKKFINKDSRLIFVGSYIGMERYYNILQEYIYELELEDVIFTGHISFQEILAYYNLADIFLCMSEHEGFCVPLIEAMKFKIPILAYKSSAVPETLKDGGILLKEKNPKITAEWIDRLVIDSSLRKYIQKHQVERIKEFSYDQVSEKYRTYLIKFIEG